jgi:FAD/FMN-containing dehydrogenase
MFKIRKITLNITKKRKVILKLILSVIGLVLICFAVWIALFFYNFKSLKLSHENQDNSKGVVTDITGLYPIQTKGIIVPHTDEEIRQAILTHERVSIGGGRYSMGGQTASEKAVQIDMREFNKIISLSTTTKEITVQTGIRWRDIQDYIDPYNLSIQIMQTYSNFTVGGSLSVNVHGRYVGLGPLVMSVKKIKVVLANGEIVEATPEVNKDIFYSAIGGLGGIGVITEATLVLVDNVNVERSRITMPTSEYKDYFFNNIRNSTSTIFHNGDMYPMDMDTISAVSWNVTDKPVTTETKLIPRKQDYIMEKIAWVIMSEWPFGKKIRQYILEPYLVYANPAVHTRNYEASYDVAELEPKDRTKTTYVLQEYFIPVEKFNEFYPKMKDVFVKNNVNLLNVSIRYAKQDSGTLMAWAKSEVFAFVIYYKQGTDEKSKDQVGRWTREMIDQVLLVNGSYYLPYQPQATKVQFLRAYPNAPDFFELKKKYDPTNKFTNNLWDTYYDPEKM